MTHDEITRKIESKEIDLRAVKKDMEGINPMTIFYGNLSLKADKIKDEIKELEKLR